MSEAYKEALTAFELGEVPVGAVIVWDGEIVSRAHNRRETGKNALYHAELSAIDAACRALGGWRLWECDLYVTLEPCPMCAAAAGWAQVSRIVYGAPDPKRGYTQFSPTLLHPRTEVLQGPLADEAEAHLKQFFKNKRG